MTFWSPRQQSPAVAARERLQVLLSHERALLARPDLLGILQHEVLAVIARHVTVEPGNVVVKFDRCDLVSTLEIDIDIPNVAAPALPARP